MVQSLEAHKGCVTTIDSHPTRACVLSAGTDAVVKMWVPVDDEEEEKV